MGSFQGLTSETSGGYNWSPSPNYTAGIGQQNSSPINAGQQAAAFIDPNTGAISSNIQNAADMANNVSPLAGLTTLGQNASYGGARVNNLATAGNTNIAPVAGMNAAQLNLNPANQTRAAQVANINMLNAQAQGQGPSVAALQAKQQGEQNVANEMAMAGSQRGSSNSALGLRQAGINTAAANQQAIQAGVQGRAAESLTAQGLLGQNLQNVSGADLNAANANAQLAQGANQFTAGALNTGAQNAQQLAQQNAQFNAGALNAGNLAQAGMYQQAGLANVAQANQANLTQGQLDQQRELANAQQGIQQQQVSNAQYNAALQAGMALNNNDMTAAMNYANMMTQNNISLQDIGAKLSVNSSNNLMGLTGAGIAGIAGLGAGVVSAASDRNLKTSIRSGKRDIKSFLSNISKSANTNFSLLSGAI